MTHSHLGKGYPLAVRMPGSFMKAVLMESERVSLVTPTASAIECWRVVRRASCVLVGVGQN